MKVSISVTNYTWPGGGLTDELTRVVRTADHAGIDTLWVADHLLQGDPTAQLDDPMLEAYTTLGYLAGQTERIRLGTMVSAATYRSPALLIKAVTTLDVLSHGRAWLGVGAGYHAEEARMMGLFLPPTAERFERLEELLRLAKQLWAGDESPFEGVHYQLDRPIGSPLPATRPHPPIVVGGTGEKVTLRLVAQYADACNLFDIPDGGQTVRHKLDVLARHCDAVGRPFDEIEKTLAMALEPGESAASFAGRARAARDLGFEHVGVIVRGSAWTEQQVETVAAALEA
ncbi:LLM class F420-dependent oxidoreductase [Jiangella alba]|uniref:Probable F420-dependent oxidoreductase, Rv1855c family n=1 Tax=Jiangella alba TaxID=561176 RepID=A0A1H5PW18_9ACTN|nr:LLM class F420-dependent oxidoreductase [Jiangella alba]SEF18006.1 probable F420-dependent oxidoreductase, Rv1855c family [Jiangella alba]